ncbi:glycosyltransferase [Actinokineospora guangxiensis]|uniref:Glycosyltransferase n=1 Tax=Actinokineospora guangxiensis TaxID=1490288 RepID=A0ABW0ES77_9PSEU
MRVLFAGLSTPGHLHPMIPLAAALRADGHDVRFAAGEGAHPVLLANGLAPFSPGFAVHEIYAEDIADDLRRLAPDLVVAGWGVPGVAEAATGIRTIWHGFGRLYPEGIGMVRPTGTGLPHIDICPPSLQDKDFLAESRVPMRPTGLPDPAPVPDLTGTDDDAGSIIYLTLGTVFGTPGLLTTAIAALSPLAARLVVAAGRVPPADLGPLPPNTTAHTWLPQDAVIGHADLVVHHAGSGTTLGALAAGVPQLLLPQGADQFANAEALTAAGAARTVTPDTPDTPDTLDTIAEAARALLRSDDHRAAARALAAEIAAMPSPAEVARALV